MAALTDEAKASLHWHWPFKARPNQLAPEGEWRTWLALAGRGFGKTEAGAQWIRQRVKDGAKNIALIAETQKDLEEVMIARIIKISPPDEMPSIRYKPVRIVWPSGATAYGYNGNEPDQLRGPEFDTAWIDELAKYRKAREIWDMLQFTMRSGESPKTFVTTTPRPIPVIREIMASSETVVTRGGTMDNAPNLAPSFIRDIFEKYDGTRLGRQELHAEILDDVPGALWTRDMLDIARISAAPDMARVVVAIDPSGTSGDDDGNSVGIVVCGRGVDGRGYVLEDLTCSLSPDGWARRAIGAYYKWGADRLVAEVNFGGAMVESVIRSADRSVAFKAVTASRGKSARAEPISALYEQGRVSHVGMFEHLEDQMTLFTHSGFQGENSPDRVDALVWGLTELMLSHQRPLAADVSVNVPSLRNGFNRR
jgi:phage terminase large subunit-like protein